MSEGLVERSWVEAHSLISPPAQPHVFLGLDGFCVRRPGRMWTGMWDLESGKAVAVVPGERQVDVQGMLERHASWESVRAVAIDLSEAYRQAVELVLPDAAGMADKFHVLGPAGARGAWRGEPGRVAAPPSLAGHFAQGAAGQRQHVELVSDDQGVRQH